jgi:hypothetical protein
VLDKLDTRAHLQSEVSVLHRVYQKEKDHLGWKKNIMQCFSDLNNVLVAVMS